MADKKTILYSVVLAILISGGMNLPHYMDNNEDIIGTYYCGSRNIVSNCDSFSSGIGSRCYYDDTYKICKEGWVQIEKDEIVVKPINNNPNYWQVRCNTNSCIEI